MLTTLLKKVRKEYRIVKYYNEYNEKKYCVEYKFLGFIWLKQNFRFVAIDWANRTQQYKYATEFITKDRAFEVLQRLIRERFKMKVGF